MTGTRDASFEASARAVPLELTVSSDTTASTITMVGELDADDASQLLGAVDEQILHHRLEIVVDVAQLTFIDASGFAALYTAGRHVRDHGGSLTVVGYDAFFARLARLCGVDDLLGGPG